MKIENKLGKNPFFDIKMGTIGALFLGGVVFAINADHGWQPALIASAKQAVYTFFIGGVMTKMAENLATAFRGRKTALFNSVLVPSVVTLLLTFGMHSLKGTPEPLNSTLPTLAFAPPGFYWWASRKRKQFEKI